MDQRDKTFLQRVKDNAFYVALGLGLLAILAVVAVYTVQQDDREIAWSSEEKEQLTADDITEPEPITEREPVKETNGETVAKATTGQSTRNDGTTQQPTQTEAVTETQLPQEPANATETAAQTDALDFTSDKTIAWPLDGEVILPYSMETTVYFKTLEQYQCNPGMLIAAAKGSTVKNAYMGKVTEVTSSDLYGNLVTVYIGNDYSVVYGQLDTVYVQKGDIVKAGASIGTVAAPTDSFTKEGEHLFFQMLKDGKPVDPMLFIEQE